MAVQIPPWLQIDPLEPARIAAATSQRRAANAAAERRAQLEEQRIFAQQQMMYARLAAQERADQRKEQVFRETRDQRLADHAANLEFRRALAAQQNQRQMRQMRLREQQVEAQTATASRKLFGMRNLQEALKQGVPMAEALAQNSADLFGDRPRDAAAAMRAARTGGPPQPFTGPGGVQGVYNPLTGQFGFPPGVPPEVGAEAYQSREITDAEGRPTGYRAIPGRGGVGRVLPGQAGLSARDKAKITMTQIGIANSKAQFSKTEAEREVARKDRDRLEKELEALKTGAVTPERLPGKEDVKELSAEDLAAEEQGDIMLPPTGEETEDMAEGDLGEAELLEDELDEEEELEEEEF